MRRVNRNQGWAIPALVAALAFVYIVVGQSDGGDGRVDIAGTAELWYCSQMEDPACQPGVAVVDVEYSTRDPAIAQLYGYEMPDQISVKMQNLTVRLSVRADAAFAQGEDLFLYADVDGDGLLGDRDQRLARSLFKGKRMVFEDIDRVLSVPVTKAASIAERFFIVRSAAGFPDQQVLNGAELTTRPVFTGLTVEAADLTTDGAPVTHKEALANLSAFSHLEDLTLSASELVERFDAVSLGAGPSELVIGPGVHEIVDDIVLGPGFQVSVAPDTVLLLGPATSIVSYSPMQMIGTEDQPIVIEPLTPGQPFGAVAVIGSLDEKLGSAFKHLHISGGSTSRINGAHLSGMLSIYRSPDVVVESSRFVDAAGEDALNIKYGMVTVEGNSFIGSAGDAFDGDFIRGALLNNTFLDSANDGVDFSGSEVTVSGNRFDSALDKCVSIGEASRVLVQANYLQSCATGIAVKDSSHATIEHNAFLLNGIAIDAFNKKPIFGDPSLDIAANYVSGSRVVGAGQVRTDQLTLMLNDGDITDLEEAPTWLQAILAAG